MIPYGPADLIAIAVVVGHAGACTFKIVREANAGLARVAASAAFSGLLIERLAREITA